GLGARTCAGCPPVPSAFFRAGGAGVGTDDGGVEHQPLQVGPCGASKTFSQTPFFAQRAKRLQTELHRPKRSGKSRQPAPVLPVQRTALTNRRLFLAGAPGAGPPESG